LGVGLVAHRFDCKVSIGRILPLALVEPTLL
jgi:hypothetical protein